MKVSPRARFFATQVVWAGVNVCLAAGLSLVQLPSNLIFSVNSCFESLFASFKLFSSA